MDPSRIADPATAVRTTSSDRATHSNPGRVHVFQKKSASEGDAPADLRTILARWKAAQEDYRRRYGKD
jgi:hypothetical protein